MLRGAEGGREGGAYADELAGELAAQPCLDAQRRRDLPLQRLRRRRRGLVRLLRVAHQLLQDAAPRDAAAVHRLERAGRGVLPAAAIVHPVVYDNASGQGTHAPSTNLRVGPTQMGPFLQKGGAPGAGS